jgi:hypothetical protein
MYDFRNNREREEDTTQKYDRKENQRRKKNSNHDKSANIINSLEI